MRPAKVFSIEYVFLCMKTLGILWVKTAIGYNMKVWGFFKSGGIWMSHSSLEAFVVLI